MVGAASDKCRVGTPADVAPAHTHTGPDGSGAWWRELVRSGSDAVVALDPRLRCAFVSDAAHRLFGRDGTEMLDASIDQLVPIADGSSVLERIDRLGDQPLSFGVELATARGPVRARVVVRQRFAYSATKGAVLAMTRCLAKDFVADAIRCNCVCPARVHTPFVDAYLAKNYPGHEAEQFAQLSAAQPIGRMGRPDEVAALVAYLCSEEAAFITGAAYDIDGGVMAMR